jgi:hypothetical protein
MGPSATDFDIRGHSLAYLPLLATLGVTLFVTPSPHHRAGETRMITIIINIGVTGPGASHWGWVALLPCCPGGAVVGGGGGGGGGVLCWVGRSIRGRKHCLARASLYFMEAAATNDTAVPVEKQKVVSGPGASRVPVCLLYGCGIGRAGRGCWGFPVGRQGVPSFTLNYPESLTGYLLPNCSERLPRILGRPVRTQKVLRFLLLGNEQR